MTTGKNDSREHISSDSRRKAAERNKNDFQIYKSKPQKIEITYLAFCLD